MKTKIKDLSDAIKKGQKREKYVAILGSLTFGGAFVLAISITIKNMHSKLGNINFRNDITPEGIYVLAIKEAYFIFSPLLIATPAIFFFLYSFFYLFYKDKKTKLLLEISNHIIKEEKANKENPE